MLALHIHIFYFNCAPDYYTKKMLNSKEHIRHCYSMSINWAIKLMKPSEIYVMRLVRALLAVPQYLIGFDALTTGTIRCKTSLGQGGHLVLI